MASAAKQQCSTFYKILVWNFFVVLVWIFLFCFVHVCVWLLVCLVFFALFYFVL